MTYVELGALLDRYVVFASVAPDDSFSAVERRRIALAKERATKNTRVAIVRYWTPTQLTCTRRLRAFLAMYSEHSWCRTELCTATRDPHNTICSAVVRLRKQGLIVRVAFGRYQIRRAS